VAPPDFVVPLGVGPDVASLDEEFHGETRGSLDDSLFSKRSSNPCALARAARTDIGTSSVKRRAEIRSVARGSTEVTHLFVLRLGRECSLASKRP